MDLQNLIDMFIDDVCIKENETPKAYRSKLKRIVDYLGVGFDPNLITSEHLESFQHYLLKKNTKMRGKKEIKGKLSLFTVKTVLTTVRHLFSWAYKKKLIKYDITSDFSIKLKTLVDPKPIDPAAIIQMVDYASQNGEMWFRARNVAIIYVLTDTGGRVGGLVHADLSHLDLSRERLMVYEKGDQPRTLHLNEPTIIALKAWISYRSELDPVDNSLFLSYRGSGISRGGVYSMLRNLAEKSKVVGRFNPHAFRHNFARECILNGADLSLVSDLMGHKNTLVTTMYYARWHDQELHKVHHLYSPGRDLPVISL